ncbi:diheme cytochrome c-553 [candidate division GN15 bacterium]|uniref:Diheme cytochrome c-553 n=1 Tax=candidate division GN15 bacterium TaxID=2072418 RepID=A0A855X2P9_9BACT|nr:MAG: diheme cytochrome c-553 [candidate division GN15 bacterium]
MIRRSLAVFLGLLALMAVAYSQSETKTQPKNPGGDAADAGRVKRGAYLVMLGGCNDCHSPKVFTAQGPQPDPSKPLSGAPASTPLPDVPPNLLGPNAWGAICTNDMTAWVGPWGVSFAANLTPDEATGLGSWSEDAFIQTMRTGKHLGTGRDILPPMPWQGLARMTDQDLKAIFAYLKSLPPVQNQVPQPLDPPSH